MDANAAAPHAARWYPAGFAVAPQFPGIAGRWDRSPHCAHGASCIALYVVSQRGCPNGLYGEIDILSGAAVVSYTSDRLGSLRPGQVGHLVFNTYDPPPGASPVLTKLNCD
jgi:hypothetical protein